MTLEERITRLEKQIVNMAESIEDIDHIEKCLENLIQSISCLIKGVTEVEMVIEYLKDAQREIFELIRDLPSRVAKLEGKNE